MVWRTPANKTSQLSSVIVVSCCVQTNSPCHVKSMGIVPMHELKVPLKYWGTLPFPSESLIRAIVRADPLPKGSGGVVV